MAMDPTVDTLSFRSTLSQYPTGVAVIATTDADGRPDGMVVGTFTSVSLAPPMVGYLPARSSRSFTRIRHNTDFCASILAADQAGLCARLASSNEDKFDEVEWVAGDNGCPRVEGALAWIEFSSADVADAGDHYFVTGSVQSLEIGRMAQPLVFFQGDYGRFASAENPLAVRQELIDVMRIVDRCGPVLEDLQLDTGRDASLVSPFGNDLVVVRAATGSRRTPLGARFPFVAPMGAVLVDPDDDAQLNRWLFNRLTPASDTRRAALGKLLLAHERGYSLTLRSRGHERDVMAAWTAYSAETRTPAQEREFCRILASEVDLYEPAISGSDLDVRSLVVKVDTGSAVRLGVRLGAFDGPLPARCVESLAGSVADAAGRMGQILASPDVRAGV